MQSLLRAQKITQKEFAQLIGIRYNTLRAWIYGNRYPDVISAYDMAKLLGVRIEYLVRGKVKPGSRLRLKQLKGQNAVSGKSKILPINPREENPI